MMRRGRGVNRERSQRIYFRFKHVHQDATGVSRLHIGRNPPELGQIGPGKFQMGRDRPEEVRRWDTTGASRVVTGRRRAL